MIALHKTARTTPAIRAEIASSGDSAAALDRRFGITEATVYKWKKRTSVHDASYTPRLQTTLTPAQECVVVELRRTLLLPLDDLLVLTQEFICPKAIRSGLDRCLRRHGVGNINELKFTQLAPVSKTFKAYEPGCLHINLKCLPQMQDASSQRYLFVAIDRATRRVFVQIKKNKTAASARTFLKAVHKTCPTRIQKRCSPTTARSSPTASLPRVLGSPPGSTSSISCAPAWTLSIGRPSPERRAPTAWWSASTDASQMSCEATASKVGTDAFAIRGLVQPPILPVNAEVKNTDSDHERLVRQPA